MNRSAAFIRATCLAVALAGAGCATSDYGRITSKIAAYDAQAIETRRELDASSDPAIKLTCLNSLIRNTENQLKIARRINPQSNPQFRSKQLTLAQATEEKTNRVKDLERRLAEYVSQRDAVSKSIHATPAAQPAGT